MEMKVRVTSGYIPPTHAKEDVDNPAPFVDVPLEDPERGKDGNTMLVEAEQHGSLCRRLCRKKPCQFILVLALIFGCIGIALGIYFLVEYYKK